MLDWSNTGVRYSPLDDGSGWTPRPITLAVIPASLASVLLVVGGIGIWFRLRPDSLG